jgi:hypothetical protein
MPTAFSWKIRGLRKSFISLETKIKTVICAHLLLYVQKKVLNGLFKRYNIFRKVKNDSRNT